MFEEIQSSEEDQAKIQQLLEIFRKERDKSAFDTEEYQDVLGTSALTSYLESTYILDKDRWN
jgi:hypothetical protein